MLRLNKVWTGTVGLLAAGSMFLGGSAQAAGQPNPPLYAISAYKGAKHLRHYVSLAKAHPKDLTDQFEAAVASFQNGKPQQAIAYYKACLRIDGKFGEADNDIGNVYRESLGNTKTAIAYYTRATKVSPDYPYGWINLGFVYQNSKKTTLAAREYLAAIRHVPSYDGGWVSLVSLYQAEKKPKLAKSYALKALKALPKNDPSVPFLKKAAKGK